MSRGGRSGEKERRRGVVGWAGQRAERSAERLGDHIQRGVEGHDAAVVFARYAG
jgi:hypothetical protein